MPPLERLSADALASELAKLPPFTAPLGASLNAVRIAMARAIASGQSADQLARDLGLPQAWRGVDLSKPPAIARSAAQPAKAEVSKQPVSAASPEWGKEIIPIALSRQTTARVVVLDREPTALGGLELPAWARALKPSATYGPITVTSPTLRTTTQKWIIIFWFTGTVEIVRAGVVLCVVPITIFKLGPPPTGAHIDSGSAWIAVNPFDPGAPAGSFAGIAVESGQVASDYPLAISSGVINLPAGASLTLKLVPSPLPAGPPGFPAAVIAPGSISVSFPASGTPSIAFDNCSAIIYEEAISCGPSNQAPSFNPTMNLLYLPGTTSATTFTPAPVNGKLIELDGSAPIETAGWALSVSQTTNPATLGAAAGRGDFAVVFGRGLTCQWTGASRAESEAAGFLIAQNAALVLFLISGSPKGVLVKQQFELWVDQNSPTQGRCSLETARQSGQPLIYAATGAHDETLEFGAMFDALIDRPVLATGARIATIFIEGILALIRNNAGNHLYAWSAAPAQVPQSTAFPLALDNAFLEVSEPLAIFIDAQTDAQFNSTNGNLLLLFGYLLLELYLPDPYTGDVSFVAGRGQPTSAFGSAATGNIGAGYLIATVIWPLPDKPALRIFDAAHAHPAIPPTTEASSTALPPPKYRPVFHGPVLQLEEGSAPAALAAAPVNPAAEAHAAAERPNPMPPTPEGVILLDLSTRASQLGVEVTTGERQNLRYTIDGLSVRGPAALLPLTTLPAIAWEPMYDHTLPVNDPGVDPNELLHPPNDGPFTQVRSLSATLIPISPLQSLQAVLDAGTGGFTARLTLPFGMMGAIDSTAQKGTILPDIGLVQPTFTLTPTGLPYTGAWQISVAAPNPAQPDPVLAGASYLRTQTDQPVPPALSYGEMVVGRSASSIFNSEFVPPVGGGVPLRRYDLTGYGASTFSEWTAVNPPTTAVIKVFFHVLVGRTSHEVIQVQSLIYPWAIKVVRTITIDRQASGVVQRYDSGWQAASDGLFQFPSSTTITAHQVHAGVIGGLIQVKNIIEVGLEITTQGTQDGSTTTGSVQVQPVTFDAELIIQPQHNVLQGAAKVADLTGTTHTCVPSKSVTGYIPLRFDYHLSMSDLVAFNAKAPVAAGPINATINIGGSNHILRATEFDATPVQDGATSGLGLACALRGVPKLSSDGAWSVAKRGHSQAAPVALSPQQGAPLVQPNKSGGTTVGNLVHYADPADIFRLDPSSTTLPDTLYGFMQTTGTQSNLLSRPTLTVGSQNLNLADALNVAHAGALLGAISSFPAIQNCLNFLSSELQPIKNQLSNPSLSTTQNLYLKDPVRKTPVTLISTSIADVNLYFYQKDDDLTKKADPPNVVITLGSPTPPSFSLDVNHLAIGLVIPALQKDPVIWFEGAFHADSDTAPSFPNLQTEFDSPLDVLATLFTVLNNIASVLSPGGSSSPEVIKPHDDSTDNAGLQTHFSDGKLSVSDSFTLPSIPLGLGDIQNVSLDIGTTLDILSLNINFLVGIGTPTAPVHWIVDPLSGTLCVQAGIQNNAIAILIQAGIGLGLAIDLGIASGSASIVIAVQLQINGSTITLMLLLTGQAQVSVLGGLASAAITLTAGLGFTIHTADMEIDLDGTASVGIHISICWVINISWSGSWTFQKQLPFNPL